MKFGCRFTAIFILISTVLGDETDSMKRRKDAEGKDILCFTTKCDQMTFIPCTKHMTHDLCINCSAGFFMPDIVLTERWEAGELDCLKKDCSCDPDSVLSNPDTCGKTQQKECECDRTKGFYDKYNFRGQITVCEHAEVKCNREGIQLGINGKCENCPAGTEKKKNDSSLCVKISSGSDGMNTPGTQSETTSFADTTDMLSTTAGTQHTPVEEQSSFEIYVIGGVAAVFVTLCASCLFVLYLHRHRKLIAIKRQLSRRLCRDHDVERGGTVSPHIDDSLVPLVNADNESGSTLSGDQKNFGKEEDKFPNTDKATNENQAESGTDKGAKPKVAKVAPYRGSESDDTMEESTVRTGDNGAKSIQNTAEPVSVDSTDVKQVVQSEQTPVKAVVPSQQTTPKTVTFSDQTHVKRSVVEDDSNTGGLRKIQQTSVEDKERKKEDSVPLGSSLVGSSLFSSVSSVDGTEATEPLDINLVVNNNASSMSVEDQPKEDGESHQFPQLFSNSYSSPPEPVAIDIPLPGVQFEDDSFSRQNHPNSEGYQAILVPLESTDRDSGYISRNNDQY